MLRAVSTHADDAETEQGRALFQELLWVHTVIRRDLETIRKLAASVLDGLAPKAVQAELATLQTEGPLWQLKVNCLRYCRFVHQHHGAEDAMLFPALRRIDPGLDGVVDRLEADHRQVSGRLDDIEAAVSALHQADEQATRERLANALGTLADELLAHLEFEELQAGPAIRRLEHL